MGQRPLLCLQGKLLRAAIWPADMPGWQDRALQKLAAPCGREKVGLQTQTCSVFWRWHLHWTAEICSHLRATCRQDQGLILPCQWGGLDDRIGPSTFRISILQFKLALKYKQECSFCGLSAGAINLLHCYGRFNKA